MEAKNVIKKLLQPTLMYQLKAKRHGNPNLVSHVGGFPYAEKNDRLPTCKLCKHAMMFVFQLHIPTEHTSTLYSFYYCFHCRTDKGSKGFKMKTYQNPTQEKMVQRNAWKSGIQYAEFEFEPQWSLPEWDALPFIDKTMQKTLTEQAEEKAEMMYEEVVEELLEDQPFEVFSFFGGYPRFLGFPYYPTCAHCEEHMDLFIQLDSDESKNMVWNDYGCLYIFRCKNESNQFHILIQ